MGPFLVRSHSVVFGDAALIHVDGQCAPLGPKAPSLAWSSESMRRGRMAIVTASRAMCVDESDHVDSTGREPPLHARQKSRQHVAPPSASALFVRCLPVGMPTSRSTAEPANKTSVSPSAASTAPYPCIECQAATIRKATRLVEPSLVCHGSCFDRLGGHASTFKMTACWRAWGRPACLLGLGPRSAVSACGHARTNTTTAQPRHRNGDTWMGQHEHGLYLPSMHCAAKRNAEDARRVLGVACAVRPCRIISQMDRPACSCQLPCR